MSDKDSCDYVSGRVFDGSRPLPAGDAERLRQHFADMADKLRAAGWRIEEPLTQANCKHPNMYVTGSACTAGSGYTECFCPACGYRSRSEWGPRT